MSFKGKVPRALIRFWNKKHGLDPNSFRDPRLGETGSFFIGMGAGLYATRLRKDLTDWNVVADGAAGAVGGAVTKLTFSFARNRGWGAGVHLLAARAASVIVGGGAGVVAGLSLEKVMEFYDEQGPSNAEVAFQNEIDILLRATKNYFHDEGPGKVLGNAIVTVFFKVDADSTSKREPFAVVHDLESGTAAQFSIQTDLSGARVFVRSLNSGTVSAQFSDGSPTNREFRAVTAEEVKAFEEKGALPPFEGPIAPEDLQEDNIDLHDSEQGALIDRQTGIQYASFSASARASGPEPRVLGYGARRLSDGSVLTTDGSRITSSGSLAKPKIRFNDDSILYSDGTRLESDGSVVTPVELLGDGSILFSDGKMLTPSGNGVEPGELVSVPDGELTNNEDFDPVQRAKEDAQKERTSAALGQLGGLLATQLYGAFGGDNVAVQLVVGALGKTLGEAIGPKIPGKQFDFGDNFGSNLKGAAVGFAGSYLGGRVAEAVFGDSEFASITLSTVGSTAAISLGQSFGILSGGAKGITNFGSNFGANIGPAAGAAIGAFAGSLVATKLFGLDSPNAQLGGQIGGTVAVAVAIHFGWIAGPIGFAVAAFIGTVFGSVLGSFFGGAPQTPLAHSNVEFRHDVGEYVITGSGESDGGSAATTLPMAALARDALNGLTDLIGGHVVNPVIGGGQYGYYGGQFFFSQGGNEFLSNQFGSAQAAIGNGIARQIRAVQIEGGDLYIKRALANSTALTFENVVEDMQVAAEYGMYLDNQVLHENVLEIGDADQLVAFEAMLTRARDANDLNLDAVAASDTYKRADAPDISSVTAPIADVFHDILDSDGSEAAFAAAEAATGLVVLDLADDGLELVAASDSEARFDIDTDGFLERTGWVGPTDGFLVMDRNRDGIINDVSEMFSTISRFNQGEGEIQSLGSLDTFALGGNGDGILDANDAGWANLRVWIDISQDGFTDIGEVQALHRFGIEAINLFSEEAGGHQAGNLVDTRSQVLQFGRNDTVEIPEAGENFFTAAYSVSFGHETLGVGSAVDGGAGFNGIEFEGGNGIRVVEGLSGASLQADPEVASFIVGGAGNDTLSVAVGAEGGAMLNGGAGDDVLTGGADNDILVGGEGIDTFSGGAGDDVFVVDDDDINEIGHLVAFDAGEGNDVLVHEGEIGLTVTSGDAVEAFFGGAGDDNFAVSGEGGAYFSGGAGNDVGLGADGDDQLDGEFGDDTLNGGAGGDFLRGGEGADELRGGAGDDILVIDADDIVIDGGEGTDTALVEGVEGVTLDLGAASIESVIGGIGDDHFTAGGTVSVEMLGEAGNDTLAGGSAGDVLDGGLGADTVDYSASAAAVSIDLQDGVVSGGDATDDVLTSIENLIGSDHADMLRGDFRSNVLEGGAGGDLIIGDVGSDTASYASSPADGTTTNGVTINLATGTVSGADAAGDTLVGIENLRGSAHDDSLTGDAGANTLDGGFGDDVLTGNGGDDTYIFGHGYGSDTVVHSGVGGTVRFGEDVLASHVAFQKSGNDLLVTLLLSDGETVLSDNTLTVQDWYLTAAADRTAFTLSDGTAFPVVDTVFGDGTVTTLSATDAGQHLVGTDALGETLIGGKGDDILVGGGGGDRMEGGAGDDTYVFARGDGAQTVYDRELYSLVQPWYYWREYTYYDEEGEQTGYRYELENRASTAQGEGGTDVLEFGTSISSSDVAVKVDGTDLIVGLTDSENPVPFSELTDTITLIDWFVPSVTDTRLHQYWGGTGHYITGYTYVTIDTPNRIESFRFADGAELAVPDILNLISSDQADVFSWTESALELELGAGDDVVTAGDYIDFLAGEDGNDTLNGGNGNNVLDGGAGNDVLTSGDGVDLLTGGDGNDVLNSGAEDDLLDGGAGDDTLTAGDGTDVLIAGTGNDVLDGGAGRDSANYAEAEGRVVGTLSTLGTLETAGTISVLDADMSTVLETDTVKGIESLVGSIYNDNVTGNAEDNRLDGGAGDDTLSGGGGVDLLRGDDGDDVLSGDAGNDHIVGGLGDDTVDGGADNDRLRGNDGNDTVIGGAGADMLFGNDGDDVLQDIGDADIDELDGGKGDDLLKGDTGDIYRFDAHAGNDTIDHTGGAASVILGAGIYLQDITFHKAVDLDALDSGPNDLIVKVNADDELRVVGWFDGSQPDLTFTLADGTPVTMAPRIEGVGTVTGTSGADMLIGGAGVDTLLGNGGNDTLIGGTGDDVLQGGAGDDLYRFEAGFGSDTLTDASGTTTVEFGSGILSQDITFDEVGSDLVVTTQGTPTGGTATVTDTLTLVNWNSATTTFVMADGEPLPVALTLSGDGNANTIAGTFDINRLVGLGGNDTLTGAAGADVLDGGTGDDALVGGGGGDMYRYERGDGFDTIDDAVGTTTVGGSGRVVFGSGIDQDDLAFERYTYEDSGTLVVTDDLIVKVDAVDAVRVTDWFTFERADRVSFRLENGAPVHMTILHQGAAGDDTLIGGSFTDHIVGGAGNDTLLAGGGDDTIDGGDGADVIEGTGRSDTLIGGAGDDFLNGGRGNDLYLYELGDGADIISDDYSFESLTNVVEVVPDIVVREFNDGENGTSTETITYTNDWVETIYVDGENSDYDVYHTLNRTTTTVTTTVHFEGGGADLLRFGAGINSANLSIQVNGDDIVVGVDDDPDNPTTFGSLSDKITIKDWLHLDNGVAKHRIERFQFEDGSILDTAGIVGLFGTDGADTITWDETALTMSAGAGDDVITGGDFQDAIEGDTGSDVLAGAGGDDSLSGGDGIDTLLGGAGSDVLEGGAGGDLIDGGAGSNVASYKNSSAAVTIALTASPTLTLGTSAGGDAVGDTLVGIGNLAGSAYGDSLTGNDEVNVLLGDAGDDVLFGGAGGDFLFGGLGVDTASYAASGTAVEVNLTTGIAVGGDAEGDVLGDVENLAGSAQADILVGDAENNSLAGNAGDDLLYGLTGNDTLEGGSGADTLNGGAGIDAVSYEGSGAGVTVDLSAAGTMSGGDAAGDTLSNFENIVGSGHADTLTGDAGDNLLAGGVGSDVLNGGSDGSDTVSYESAQQGLTADLVSGGSGGDAAGDSYSNIDNVIGSGFDDTLAGDGAANILEGGAGNDTLDGRGGSDTASFGSAFAGVTADLSAVTVTAVTSDGTLTETDTLSNMENLSGSAFDDTLSGDGGVNVLSGQAGDDVLDGAGGADTLEGGSGQDTLLAGTGDDVLDGGSGFDRAVFDAAGGAVTISVSVDGDVSATNTVTGTDALIDIDRVDASDSADVLDLSGYDAAIDLYGLAGNDTLIGGDGSDLLDGGAGDDTLTGGDGFDRLVGGTGSDLFVVDGDDTVVGEGSNLVTHSEDFSDASWGKFDASVTVDVAIAPDGTETADLLTPDALGNADLSFLPSLTETGTYRWSIYLKSADGSSISTQLLVADNSSGSTVLTRETIEITGDWQRFSVSADIVNTGQHSFRLGSESTLTEGENVYVWGAQVEAGNALGDYVQTEGSAVLPDAGVDRVESSESFVLPNRVDVLALTGTLDISATGNADGNTLTGNVGANVLSGLGGGDTLLGGDGNDTLAGGTGADWLDGGAGLDMASFAEASAGVTVDLSAGSTVTVSVPNGTLSETDTLVNIESAFGSAYDDVLTGSTAANILLGGAGHDTLLAGDGDDTLGGGDGSDVLSGGAGTDTAVFTGNASDFSASWSGSTLTVTALTGDGGSDTLTGIEALQFDDYGMTTSGTNIGPIAVADTVATNKDAIVNGDVLSGAGADLDIDGGTLTVTAVEGVPGDVGVGVTLTSGALLTLDSDGTFDYDPNGMFDSLGNGATETDSFTYSISDGQGGTSSATVTVMIGSVNYAPDAVDDTVSATEDVTETITAVSLLGNDIDLNGDTLTVSSVQNAVNGTATLDVNGNVLFTPDANFNGAATFQYTTNDGNGATSSATVTVNVAAVNDAPMASGQSITLTPNGTGVGTLSSTDVDTGQQMSYSVSAAPSDGLVEMGTDGVFSYRPELGFYGTDSFIAQVDDGSGGTDTATVSITVSNPAGLIAGTASNETVSGNGSANALYGFAGNDTLSASNGSDQLYGGTGNDRLLGGQGNDTYGFLTGDGQDTIHDKYHPVQSVWNPNINWDDESQSYSGGNENVPVHTNAGQDIIAFGSQIDVSNVVLDLSGAVLKVGIVDGASPDTVFASLADGVTVENWTNNFDKVETLKFFDGTTINISSLSTTQNALGNTTGVTQTGGSSFDWLAGGSGGDTITGNAGGDVLIGLGGADVLNGGAGADVLSGGDGMDTASYINSAAGVTVDLSVGTASGGDAAGDTLIGIESLNGSNHADTLTGTDGTNTLYGNGGNDVVDGGAGDDLVDGGAGDDIVYGRDGNDLLYGVDGADTLYGGDGSDTLVAGSGNDIVSGEGGDDWFRGDLGNDTLDGGAGTDAADYFYATGAVNIDLAGGTMTGTDGNDVLISIENASGSNTGDDTITGDAGANVLNGVAGNDVLEGGAGDDVLDGGAGTDTASFASASAGVAADLTAGTASGGAGSDTLLAFENLRGSAHADTLTGDSAGNVLEGQGGNDRLAGGAGDDTLDGGAGSDTVDYYGAAGAVTINLDTGGGNGTATGEGSDTLIAIENVEGSNVGNDTITGDAGANSLLGHGGNDTLSGEDGADYLDGGAGSDILNGGGGADYLNGGAGSDILNGGDGADSLDGGAGFDTLNGGIGDDTLDAGADGGVLNGDDGNDLLLGQGGNDTLNGGVGDDTLDSRGGNDVLNGGDGLDTALFSGQLADYAFSLSGATLTVTDQVGATGTNTLSDIELLSFADNSLVFENGNLSPVALADAATTNQNTVFSGDVLSGPGADFDVDGGTLTVSGVNAEIAGVGTQTTLTSGALLTVNADGTYDYDPNGQFNGLAANETDTDQFTYDVADGQGGTSTGTVTVTINGLNDAPTIGIDRVFLLENTPIAIPVSSLLSNDSDADGDTPIFTGIQNPTHGSVQIDSNGDIAFTPDTDFNGEATFEYSVVDGRGGTSIGTVTVDVGFALAGTNASQTLTGGIGGDRITAGGGNDVVFGGAGWDTITGEGGQDALYGEAGDDLFLVSGTGDGYDTIDGGAGTDKILGSAADDTIGLYTHTGTAVVEEIDGGLGINIIKGPGGTGKVFDFSNTILTNIARIEGGGVDTITGSSGNDTIVGGTYNDKLYGGAGDDVFVQEGAGHGFDSVTGGDGYDRIIGGNGDDTIGLYTFTGTAVVEEIDGGLGTNIIKGPGGTGRVFDFSNTILKNIARIEGGGIDTITGSSGNDTIFGGTYNDKLYGGAGDDVLNGGVGGDLIDGGAGNDTASYRDSTAAVAIDLSLGTESGGYAQSDTLIDIESLAGSIYADTLIGDSGDNTLNGGAGDDTLVGGAGNDGLSYAEASSGVTVDLVAGTASGGDGSDTLSGFENIMGSEFADTLTGDSGDNILNGGAGDDTLVGGAGNDGLSYAGASSGVTVDLVAGTASGGDGSDTLSGFENITGSEFADTLTGESGDNTLNGGAGDDTLTGGVGDDLLNGGAGVDEAHYSGNVLGYSLSDLGSGTITVSDIDLSDGDDGTDVLTDIENAVFANGTLSLDGSVNNAPFARDSRVTVAEDGTVAWHLSGDDFEEGSAGLSFAGKDGTVAVGDGVGFTTSNGGTVTVNADGTFTYEAASGFGGQDSFEYQTTDAGGLSSTATVDIEVGSIDAAVFDGASELVTSFATAGNRQQFTLGTWFNRSALGGDQVLFGGRENTPNYMYWRLDAQNRLALTTVVGNVVYRIETTETFADLGVWHQVAISVDTSRASERIEIYVDGEKITAFDQYQDVPLNASMAWNYTGGQYNPRVGSWIGALDFFNGSMAHTFALDGVSGTASDFGVASPAGDWVALGTGELSALVSATGGNSFLLDFADPSALGQDASSNGIDFTVAGTIAQGSNGPAYEIAGAFGHDMLVGDSGANVIDGGAGDDFLVGGAGDDMMDGGADADTLTGAAGDDTLLGGDGADIAVYAGAVGDFALRELADGSVSITGSATGTDVLRDVEALWFDADTDGVVDAGELEDLGNATRLDGLVGGKIVLPVSWLSQAHAEQGVTGRFLPDGTDTTGWTFTATASDGTVVVNGDGTYTYKPPADTSSFDNADSVAIKATETATGLTWQVDVDVEVGNQGPDTPNVYSVLDANNKASSLVLSADGLDGDATSYYQGVRGTQGVSEGKWYMEYRANPWGTYARAGFVVDGLAMNTELATPGAYWAYLNDGTDFYQGTNGFQNNVFSSIYNNQTHDIGLALDLDNFKVYVSYDGVWQNSADPDAGTGGFDILTEDQGKVFYPFFAGNDVQDRPFSANFGSGDAGDLFDGLTLTNHADAGGDFLNAPPGGFQAINTHNIDLLDTEADYTSTDGNDVLVGSAQTTVMAGGAGDDVLIAGNLSAPTTPGALIDLTAGTIVATSGFVTTTTFDGNTNEASSTAALIHTGSGGFIGQSWGTAQGISLVRMWRPTDVGYDGTAGTATITFTVEGANNADWSDAVSLGSNSVADYDGTRVVANAYVDITVDTTAYAFHRVVIATGGNGVRVAEAEFFSVAPIETVTLSGAEGDDYLVAGAGDDVVNGGTGDDTLVGGSGDDTLDGGTGTDQASYASSGAAVTINLSTGTGSGGDAQGDTLTNIENLQGSNTGGDNLTGDSGANALLGLGGNDSLNGGAGDDVLDGGAGNDTLNGGAGSDLYMFGRGDGVDTLDNTGSDGSSTDTLAFDAGIASDQLWLTQSGNNLEISIIGLSDTVSLTNWFTDSAKRVDRIEVADEAGVLEANEVQALVSAMASFSAANPAWDPAAETATPTALDSDLLAAWDA